jgi:gliding motility-associated-like protein
MTDGMEHIDELFRSKLANAEVPAPNGVMEALQSNLASGASQHVVSQSASSVWSSAIGLKVAGIAAVVGLSIGGVIWLGNDEQKPVKTSPEKQKEEKGISLEVIESAPKITDSMLIESRSNVIKYSFGDPQKEEMTDLSEDQSIEVYRPPMEEMGPIVQIYRNNESRNNVKKVEVEEEEMEVQTFGLPDQMNAYNDVKPNVFTPNGDGINDSFFVELNTAEFVELVVLNRAGMKVFGTTDKNRKWAGDHLGMPCSPGSYRVILKTKNSKTQVSEGDQWVLNLIR